MGYAFFSQLTLGSTLQPYMGGRGRRGGGVSHVHDAEAAEDQRVVAATDVSVEEEDDHDAGAREQQLVRGHAREL
jgi:hypothetical protein